MQLENIIYGETHFNLLINRYQDTNTIAIMIQKVNEDYYETITENILPDEDELFENEIDSELVTIPDYNFKLVNTLIEYGLIEKELEIVNFFEGTYFYKPTQELIDYLEKLNTINKNY